MSKERLPKTKILSHSATAIGGVAIGVLAQRHRNNQLRRANEAARFKVLRLNGDIKQAGYDEVTDLPLRWAIKNTYQGLASAWRIRNRSRSSELAGEPKADKHSLLMIDLDNFKAYNDTHGHNAGDELLHLVGGVMSKRLRGRDVLARWGGEEFAVLLPRATEVDAAAVAEELRESIEATGQIKASFGVTEVDLAHPLKYSVDMADQALYAAKDAGRNQVVAYSSLVPS